MEMEKQPKTQESRPSQRIDPKNQDQFQKLTPRTKTNTKSAKKPRLYLVPRPRSRFFQKMLVCLQKLSNSKSINIHYLFLTNVKINF
jgi:hypothetical protein